MTPIKSLESLENFYWQARVLNLLFISFFAVNGLVWILEIPFNSRRIRICGMLEVLLSLLILSYQCRIWERNKESYDLLNKELAYLEYTKVAK